MRTIGLFSPLRGRRVLQLMLVAGCFAVAGAGCGGGSDAEDAADRRATTTTDAASAPAPSATPASPPATPTPAQVATATPTPAAPAGRSRRRPSADARKRDRRRTEATATPSPTPTPAPTPTPTPEADSPTRAQVIARGDRICRRYGEDLEELPAADTPEELVEYYGRAGELADRAVSRLQRLRPPAAGRRTFRAYVELLQENADLIRDLQRAIGDRDEQARSEIEGLLTRQGTRAARLARRYGFRVCGGPAE